MRPKYRYGEAVRVRRTVRNDGTFPGIDVGKPLVRRGSVGYVRDVGTFLQDQLIYSVHFVEVGRMVGCREEELQLESDPWTPSRFEYRDKVTPRLPLGLGGVVVAEPGSVGEIQKVLRDGPGGVTYHVLFCGRTLEVPEKALEWANHTGGAPG